MNGGNSNTITAIISSSHQRYTSIFGLGATEVSFFFFHHALLKHAKFYAGIFHTVNTDVESLERLFVSWTAAKSRRLLMFLAAMNADNSSPPGFGGVDGNLMYSPSWRCTSPLLDFDFAALNHRLGIQENQACQDSR